MSGAGIETLQSLADVPLGDANLIAPRGTVDAGARGIRVSGNLNVVALLGLAPCVTVCA
ncbi:filamentous haemagglutinin family protein [Paraburkholderia sp.]|uniref:filamentous haemagglutinin family protein n=1 Tax=Paraburkholderia sp. TaxID=1926495 RepID=UPI00260EDB9E|nr:filamentous haemagglutinin family protein [Paraburkholderia sp.]